MRRVACSMTASTNRCTPVTVTVSKKSQASRAPAWERRKLAQVVESRSGAGSIPASWRISHTVEAAVLNPEDEEFAVDAAVAPARVLSRQAHNQQADGADGTRPARALWARSGRVAARQQVPVPAQHRVRPDQEPEPAEHLPREAVQQGGQERPVGGGESRPVRAQLPLQDCDLVA